METLLVKINENGKASILIEMLKSMDFVSSVDYFDNLIKTRRLFDEVNQLAAETELSEMTMDDIIAEIKTHRLEKQSNSN
ncbi:MAG: hypothetical protein H6553_04610 [Chitinophagales bacterium]|nr:hypothetical protein [Chitinophagales bacterium]